MNKNSLSSLLVILASLFFLSFKVKQKTYHFECASLAADGYVELRIWDQNKCSSYSLDQACKDGIHAILYAGISSSNGCASQPPILSTPQESDNFRKIERSFFSKKGKWVDFSRSSGITKKPEVNSFPSNCSGHNVLISKNQLRKFLEDQKIIKPLNSNF